MVFTQLTILSLQGLCCTAHTGTHNHNFSNIIFAHFWHKSWLPHSTDLQKITFPVSFQWSIYHFSPHNSRNESQYWIIAVRALNLQPCPTKWWYNKSNTVTNLYRNMTPGFVPHACHKSPPRQNNFRITYSLSHLIISQYLQSSTAYGCTQILHLSSCQEQLKNK
jgi:hypothetical protein